MALPEDDILGMKNSIIGFKELRENADTFISQIEKGRSFIVVRRSKPIFKISPPTDEQDMWETVVDFTEFYKEGIPASKLLRKLRSLDGKS